MSKLGDPYFGAPTLEILLFQHFGYWGSTHPPRKNIMKAVTNNLILHFTALIILLLAIYPTAAKATGSEKCNGYIVSYGAPGTPGRVYDPLTDITKFTYTVSGSGQSCGALKFFSVEVPMCEPALNIVETTPYYSDWDPYWHPVWHRPMPDLYLDYSNPEGADPHFDLYGIQWFGDHGYNTPPPLVEAWESKVFMISFAGEVEEGEVDFGTRHIFNGKFVKQAGQIPGPSCGPICENRVSLFFNELEAGDIVSDQYQDLGISITTTNANPAGPHAAMIFDSAEPTGNDFDLGTPNRAFGGPGSPLLNFRTGSGVGNFNPLEKLLIIAENLNIPDDSAEGGVITIAFDSPTRICSAKLIDIDKSESGGKLVGTNDDGDIVFSKEFPRVGNNSVQTINVCELNGFEVTRLDISLEGSGAIDDLNFCVPPPTPEPTPTPTPCSEIDISDLQLELDGGIRRQARLVKRATVRLRRIDQSRAARRFVRRAKRAARDLANEGWTLIYSIPSLLTTCEDIPPLCTESTSNQETLALYSETSNALLSLLEQVVDRTSSARGEPRRGDQGLRTRGGDLASQVQTTASQIPGIVISCTS